MSDSLPEFVEWREQLVNQERGSRLVHYYLDDSSGQSYLAVVGTERSLRHMLYVASEEFCQAHGSGKLAASALKWRSRREVIDWLASFIPGRMRSRSCFKSPVFHPSASGMSFNGLSDNGSNQDREMEFGRTVCGQSSDITWSGNPWTCGKQLKHYQAFCRNGITIGTHSFVLVMSEGENRYLAYLEDMYEDKKGQKKVKVRWFHQNQEFSCTIPPPTPHPCEVFITSYSQVISVECVDDIATVLTPDHFEKCLAMLPHSYSAGVRFCFRQYNKNKFKVFDLSTLRGYFNQAVLSCLEICSVSGDEFGHGNTIKNGGSKRIRVVKGAQKSLLTGQLAVKTSCHAKQLKNSKPAYPKSACDLTIRRPLSVKFVGPHTSLTPTFKVDDKIELLCQDSGIRGCWFKCTVLQSSQKRLKVQYDDVQEEDCSGNLEEWVPAYRMAAPDKLGMRCSGRLNIRPSFSINCLPDDVVLDIGTPVDAWWSDGWWEGVVTGVESSGDDGVQVYFPGEDIFLVCQRKSLRISKDWVGNQWVAIEARPDILSTISLVSPQAKLTSCSAVAKGAESGSSVMSGHGAIATQANSNNEDKQTDAIRGAIATQANSNDEDKQTDATLTQRNNDDLPSDCGVIATQVNSNDGGKKTDGTITQRNNDDLLSDRGAIATQANSNDGDKQRNGDDLPFDHGATATQANSNDEDKQTVGSLTTKNNDDLLENLYMSVDIEAGKDIESAAPLVIPCSMQTSCPDAAKMIVSDSSEMHGCGEIAVQVNSTDDVKQIEASSAEGKYDASPDNTEQLNLKKRHRDEGDHGKTHGSGEIAAQVNDELLENVKMSVDTEAGKDIESPALLVPCSTLTLFSEMHDRGEITGQANSIDEVRQIEASSAEGKADASLDDTEQLNLKKRHRDEGDDGKMHGCR